MSKHKKKKLISFRFVIGLFLTVIITGAILLSINWSSYMGLNKIKKIDIYSTGIIQDSQYSESLSPLKGENIHDIDIREVCLLLESHPFVHAARISRDYPNTLRVEIVERMPVALLNIDPVLYLDRDGVVLQELGTSSDYILPILSGFNTARELYPIGHQTVSQKVLISIHLIDRLLNEYPSLYNNLSEVTLNSNDEFVLILSEYPTKIILGTDQIWGKIKILDAFEQSLPKNKQLHDFTILDLRYNRQVIARERT